MRNWKTILCCVGVIVLAAGSMTVGALAGEDTGAVVIGVTNLVDKIDPTNNGDPWSLTADGISETIFRQDAEGKLVSHIAESIKQKDDMTWELTLKENVKFSDGSNVNAQAVADCMNEIMEKNAMATASAGVITFTAVDETTVELVTERKTTVMPSVLCEWTNVVYRTVGEGEYVFTGPYMVKNLDAGVALDLVPNPYYDEKAESRPEVTMKKFEDATAMQQAFEGGEIDMAFTITPDAALALEGEGFLVKDIDAGYQYFALLNQGRAPLDDLNVRKAINLALNREDMVSALRGGRVGNGFFAQYYDFAGETEEVFDPEAAKALLEEAGYVDSDGDGIVEKDGEKLSIEMCTYASRPDLSTLMLLSADCLDGIGIEVTTQIVDSIDNFLAEGNWDVAFYAQHTAPTGEPAYALNQFFRTGEGKNNNGYSNEEVDGLLDQMGDLQAGDERNALAKEIQAILAEDLPVIYLVDPQWHIAVSDRLADYQPYCGDYYVVNDSLGLAE